jgi:hypothetical protein
MAGHTMSICMERPDLHQTRQPKYHGRNVGDDRQHKEHQTDEGQHRQHDIAIADFECGYPDEQVETERRGNHTKRHVGDNDCSKVNRVNAGRKRGLERSAASGR